LTEDDFADYPTPQTEANAESKLYLVHLAELASRVGRCLVAKFCTSHDRVNEHKRYQELVDFEKTLNPSFLNLPSTLSLERGFWPSLIQLYYYDYQIVFHRMLSTTQDNGVTFIAAAKISRILEDLLASGVLYRAPFMVLPAIFASILVHIIHVRKGDEHLRVIAKHRAGLAMLILETFEKAWPLAIWTRHLLDMLLKDSPPSRTSPKPRERSDAQLRVHSDALTAARLSGTNHVRQADAPKEHQVEEHHLHNISRESNNLPFESATFIDSGANEHLESPLPNGTNPDHSDRYNTAVQSDMSSIALMFPLNNLLEDAGLDLEYWQWDFDTMDENM